MKGDKTRPRGYKYPTPPILVKSRMIHPLPIHFLHSQQIFFVLVCIRAGNPRVPPRVLAQSAGAIIEPSVQTLCRTIAHMLCQFQHPSFPQTFFANTQENNRHFCYCLCHQVRMYCCKNKVNHNNRPPSSFLKGIEEVWNRK